MLNVHFNNFQIRTWGPGWLNELVGLPNNSYKPITNTAWVCAWLCKLQIWLAATSDKAYQLLAHGRWFSPGTPASSTTKTGRHDIAEILLKVALSTKNQSNKLGCKNIPLQMSKWNVNMVPSTSNLAWHCYC